MLLLGLDVGTSSVKASVVNATTQKVIASASYPETEAAIIAPKPGWAEQDPEQWWIYVQQAILKCNATGTYNPADIGAIGIAYQMHGLVMVDKQKNILRNAIIWCDSRCVDIGDKAFSNIGEEKCLTHLLNAPGNFTASKLAWVKQHEPDIYERIDKIMLPGDFIAMKLTGEITTSISALSEGVFWDFKEHQLSKDVMDYFGFSASLLPEIHPVFSLHGYLEAVFATKLSLKPGIPVSYKAGDQPNNALSLNVMQPGEVAATAGTSGVIYGISNSLLSDKKSRINSFAHVNHTKHNTRIGVLLCINGTGIFNRWIKNITGENTSYNTLNAMAAKVEPGSKGILAMPFGNGAERILNNKIIGAHFHHIDFNQHSTAHLIRAVQEGIAFSFRYGLDIMRENGTYPNIIRAAKTNLFLSEVFTQTFSNVTNLTIEFYDGDGSFGAAIGSGIGVKFYNYEKEAFRNRQSVSVVNPVNLQLYEALYQTWKQQLQTTLTLKNNS